MAEDPAERFTQEALELHGTREMARDYRAWSESRQRMFDDLGARVTTLERGFERMEGRVEAMSNGIVNQGALLSNVDAKIDAIQREQTLESGWKQGMAAANARADRAEDKRSSWAQVVVPMVAGLLGAFAVYFVQDVAQGETIAELATEEVVQ